MKFGHWEYNGDLDTTAFGFLYLITNTANNRKYVGIKQFSFKRGKRRVPSGWQDYTGSSKWLNDDISKLGINKFNFIILGTYKDKPSLKYAEAKFIIENDCLYSRDWYNQFIGLKLKVSKEKFSQIN